MDRDRLAALGLDLGEMSETLRTRVQGSVPTRFKEEDRQIDVRVRNAGITESSQDDVRHLVLPGPDGPIRLVSVADVQRSLGIDHILKIRNDYRRAVACINFGKLVSDVAPRSKLSRDLRSLARHLCATRAASTPTGDHP